MLSNLKAPSGDQHKGIEASLHFPPKQPWPLKRGVKSISFFFFVCHPLLKLTVNVGILCLYRRPSHPICPELRGGSSSICLYMILGYSRRRGDGGAKWLGGSDKCDTCNAGCGYKGGLRDVMRSDRHIISLADRKKKADHVLALIACFT